MLLYSVKFAVPGWVQFWFSFQTSVAIGMGLSGFFFPNSPAITLGGYWEYLGEDANASKSTTDKKRVLLAPNVRGWGLRNAIPGLVNILAMYFGTREAYIIMAACAVWREAFDILEAFLENNTGKVFLPMKIPSGKFPPLGFFPPYLMLQVVDLMSLYFIMTVSD